eukprot:612023-Pelagomonas_calceolata.AAC.1
MASPLDHNPQYQHNWSSDPQDTLFGACHNSPSSRFSGFSVCHPTFDGDAMTWALRHAICSAILNTEATANFMILPVWGQHIKHPYSKLITAYPHLYCELGTIACTNLCYNDPQSCPNEEIPLSQHTWDLLIIAVWNTAARNHLNNHNPAWLRGLAAAVSEAKLKTKKKLRRQ